MLKTLAIIFGIVFLLVGILGFIPLFTPGGHLLGLFHVNTAHNIVHLLTGALALFCGMVSGRASKLFFQIFGVVYLLVALLGLYYQDQAILGIIANNVHDIWLHFAIAFVALYLGFVYKEEVI